MKFGELLAEYMLPEWRHHYIPYKPLQKLLEEELPDQWRQRVEEDAIRVGEFVEAGLVRLESQLKDLEAQLPELPHLEASSAPAVEGAENAAPWKVDDDDDGSFLELRYLESLGRVTQGASRLRDFAELNHAAVYKLLKKHDKLLGLKEGLGVLLPRLVGARHFGDAVRFDGLDAKLRMLSLRCSPIQGLDASAEVARLAAGLGRSPVGSSRQGLATGSQVSQLSNDLKLGFFLGSSITLFIAIGVLLAVPARAPHHFDVGYFLAPMPVFRVIFSLILLLWCLGEVMRTCDMCDINIMFILGLDPRCRLTPEYFFSKAAVLTTLWSLAFATYVIDYKWRVFPHVVWDGVNYDRGASLHFVSYPVLLILLTAAGMMWPSRICRNRYKCAVVRSMKRVACAPIPQVTFADNVVGDILTSLAKPLQDVPAAFCYLASPHPVPRELVDRFILRGDLCSDATHHVVLPIIAGLPYVFRTLQCLRRFRDTRDWRHAWNFGKYISCLLVVVVASVWSASHVSVALISTVATLYAFVWDVLLDWGLGRPELLGRPAGEPPGVQRQVSGEHGMERRRFSRRAYWLCGLLDLSARSTWVLTLMPMSTLTSNAVARVLLVSIISCIEILRRSMWTVLRVENEQISNASGYRVLLWVPSKLNKSLEQRPRTAELTRPLLGEQVRLP